MRVTLFYKFAESSIGIESLQIQSGGWLSRSILSSGSNFEQPQLHQLTSYGHGSGTSMISTLNCIKYFLTWIFQKELVWLGQGESGDQRHTTESGIISYGSHFEKPRIHQLTSYGHGSSTKMISTLNCIKYFLTWIFQGELLELGSAEVWYLWWSAATTESGILSCGSHFEQPRIHQFLSYEHGSGTRMISTLNCIKYFLTWIFPGELV